MKRAFFLFPLLLTSCASYDNSGEISSGRYPRSGSRQQNSVILQAQVDTCEQEIALLQSRIHGMESIIANSPESVLTTEVSKDHANLETRLRSLEESVFRLQGNLDQIVDFSNEGAKKVAEALSRITTLDTETSRDIKNLEGALRNLTTVVKETPSSVSVEQPRKYKVSSGDTLGKIARTFDTSVETLMELNALKRDDFIVVGQELILPSA